MLGFPSTRQAAGWLAIVSQQRSVVLARAQCGLGVRPEITLLESFAIDGDLSHALQRLRNSHKLDQFACTTLMPAGDYSLTQLEAPNVPQEERREALRWAIKEMVSYPVDTACIDVLDLPNENLPAGRATSVLVVSAAEKAVKARLAAFVEAKVNLQAIDIAELAQRNVAALLEDENRGLAFLRVDESGMMLTLTFHGELVAVRSGEITTGQLNHPDAEHSARAHERLALELQRSLDNFDRQHSHIPISKVIVACSPSVENLLVVLKETTNLPLQAMDLSSAMNFPSVPELRDTQYQARHLLAIGAALRCSGGAE